MREHDYHSYLAVRIQSVAGETISRRAQSLNRYVQRLGVRLLLLTRRIRFYSSKQRCVLERVIPLLYDYAFIGVPRERTAREIVRMLSKESVPVSVVGVLSAKDVAWVREQCQKTETLDLTDLGKTCRVGEMVRVVAGPFCGYVGALIGRLGKLYVIDIEGLRLQVSKHLIRGLAYDAADNDIDSFLEYIR